MADPVTLGDRIEGVMVDAGYVDGYDDFEVSRATTAVLAMPEMQAMRAVVIEWAHSLAHGCNDATNHGPEGAWWRDLSDDEQFRRWVQEAFEDFPHVAAWVLDGAA